MNALSLQSTGTQQAAQKFDKLTKMVQDMIDNLFVDQKEDDKSLKWCKEEKDRSEDNLTAVKSRVQGSRG
jgi:hypothetical protein